MVSNELLQDLLAWKTPDRRSPILSLYIDRKTGTGFWNAEDLAPIVKGLVKDLEPEGGSGDASLEQAVHTALAALETGTWTERSLAVFVEPGGRVRTAEWNVPVSSQARWSESPYLLPLLEILGGHERYVIALADREKARLFSMFLGTIREERDAVNPENVQRVASTGSDQARTMNLQRRADEHAHIHLKHVVSMLEAMAREERFDRLILGGPTEAVHRLRGLLPPRLAAAVAGVVHVPVEASKEAVLEEAEKVERRTAEGRKQTDVLELETASAKRDRATAGLDRALEALHERRIRTLLYADGLVLRGRRCGSCGSLFEENARRCGYCRGATRPVDDLLNEMAGRVAESGGRVEAVAPPAADRLRKLGGLGAFLRF